ncbi:MAG: YdcF family protein, partial [Mycobacteriales bacterium]
MLPAFRLARRVAALAVLAVLLVVGGTASRVWWVARGDAHPKSDAIVVLGASQFDGRPSTVFRARLQHARQLYEEGVAPRVVTLGGGAPGDRYTEAAAGARFLADRGVQTVAVEKGRNTLQSLEALDAEFTKRGWSSAVIVTDPWHSLRSRRMAG